LVIQTNKEQNCALCTVKGDKVKDTGLAQDVQKSSLSWHNDKRMEMMFVKARWRKCAVDDGEDRMH
jgi:hypothetical protein